MVQLLDARGALCPLRIHAGRAPHSDASVGDGPQTPRGPREAVTDSYRALSVVRTFRDTDTLVP